MNIATSDGPATTELGTASRRVEPPEPSGVRLVGRHVGLQAVRPQDYDLLRSVELGEDLAPLWRHQGSTPSPERWVEGLWNGVLAQFIAVGLARNEPIGLVSAYNVDFRHRYGFLGAAKFDMKRRSPLFLEGVALFIDYAFTCWDLRKLYLEASALSLAEFGSGINFMFEEEGRLRAHRYFGGKYWDQYLLALYRETWEEIAADLRRFL
jgi:RimJ/RimL family protein N-acetyltransferase